MSRKNAQFDKLRRLSGEGAFVLLKKGITVYKKTMISRSGSKAITTLRIPKGTTVFTGTRQVGDTGKMRAQKARVVKNVSMTTGKELDRVGSIFDFGFKYQKGKTVRPSCFSREKYACAGGVHFFLTMQDAKNY